MLNQINLEKSKLIISDQIGILNRITKLPLLNRDPKLIGYGIWPANTEYLNASKFGGRSSGTGTSWEDGFMSTIGETVERYCPAFYRQEDNIHSTYNELNKPAIHPDEFALYHPKQYELYAKNNIDLVPFTTDTKVHWTECRDLVSNKDVWCPSICIYMPWELDQQRIIFNTSTGLAAHTDMHKAMLTALYEIIERDSFVTVWSNKMKMNKIVIDQKIKALINDRFPDHYEFHFIDITLDLGVPTVFGMCFGEAEFGKFVAVGSSTRGTLGEALKKVLLEMGQAVSYFRWALGNHKKWEPSNNFYDLRDFELHSIYYTKRPDLWGAFAPWRDAEPTKEIDVDEQDDRPNNEKIKSILKAFKKKNLPVLFKDITTVDVADVGFYAVKIYVPQLIQLSGGYPFYFFGGKRLYETPKAYGLESKGFDGLNKFPHPFP